MHANNKRQRDFTNDGKIIDLEGKPEGIGNYLIN